MYDHAILKMMYAEDCHNFDRPWELWQCNHGTGDGWVDLKGKPSWRSQIMYRRKTGVLPVKTYYMVHGIGRLAPKKRHDTVEEAHQEARRLAALHPGIDFYVLEALCKYRGEVQVTGTSAVSPSERF